MALLQHGKPAGTPKSVADAAAAVGCWRKSFEKYHALNFRCAKCQKENGNMKN